MSEIEKNRGLDPIYRIFIDYTRKEIQGVHNYRAEECVPGASEIYENESAFNVCEDLLYFGGFTPSQPARGFPGFSEACELWDSINGISLRTEDVNHFIGELNDILNASGNEAMLTANFKKIKTLFDAYVNRKYDIEFFKRALLQIDSGHTGQARMLLALYSINGYRKFARALYRMDEFKSARRILDRTFLARENKYQHYKLMNNEDMKLNDTYVMGVFYSLADLKSSEVVAGNYLGLTKTEAFSQLGETFYKLEFHDGKTAVLFGIGAYDRYRDEKSYIVVKYFADGIERDTADHKAAHQVEGDVRHVERSRRKGSGERTVSAKDGDIEPNDATERKLEEEKLKKECSDKWEESRDMIDDIQEDKERTIGNLMHQHYYCQWGHYDDGSVVITYKSFYPTDLEYDQYLLVQQEIAMYNEKLHAAGLTDVTVVFDSQGFFDDAYVE